MAPSPEKIRNLYMWSMSARIPDRLSEPSILLMYRSERIARQQISSPRTAHLAWRVLFYRKYYVTLMCESVSCKNRAGKSYLPLLAARPVRRIAACLRCTELCRTKWASPLQLPCPSVLRGLHILSRRVRSRSDIFHSHECA